MVKLKRKTLVLAKIESSYGVDPTPTVASNAILTLNAEIKETFEQAPRDIQITSLTKKQFVGAKKFAEVTFSAEVSGSGSAGTAPRLGTLLRGCSMAETTISSTSNEYTPTSSSQESVTLYVFMDGVLHKVTGAMGSWKLTSIAGQQAVFEFKFMGIYNTPTDTAPGAATYDGNVDSPPLVTSATLTYNSTAFVVNQIDIDIANSVVARPSVNASTAIAGFHITDRNPIASFDPEAESVATYDFNADILTTPRDFTFTIGSSAGNRVVVDIPKFNPTELTYSDRDQTLVKTVNGQCSDGGSADDEISLLFN